VAKLGTLHDIGHALKFPPARDGFASTCDYKIWYGYTRGK